MSKSFNGLKGINFMCHHESKFCAFILFLGRVCISLLFIIIGVQKIMNYGATLTTMTGAGIPHPKLLIILAIIFELGGGILVLLGLLTRLGAILLIVFVILTTHFFHSFWMFQDAEKVSSNFIHFFKNLTIIGGLIYVLVHGGGRLSFDNCLRKKETN